MVAERRQELVEQIAVRAVQLDDVETKARTAHGGVDEGLLDALQADRIEGDRRVPFAVEGDRRCRVGRPRQVGRLGLGEGAPALPRPLRRGLAAGMGELDAEFHLRHPGPRPIDHGLQRRFVLVAVQAGAALGDAAVTLDMRRLHAEQAGARHRQHAVMHLVPRLGAAIDRRILAHRRHDDSIGQRDAADLDRGEELGGHGRPFW
jgi:hypothetical protein